MNGDLWVKAIVETVDNIAMNVPSGVITNLLGEKYDMELNDARALLLQVRSRLNQSNLSDLEAAKQDLIYLSQTSSPLGLLRNRVLAKAAELDDKIKAEKSRINHLTEREGQLMDRISDIQDKKAHTTMSQILKDL